MDNLNFNSVETLPNLSARAAFQVNSSAVFKEDVDIVPVIIDDTLSYMPWGGDNNMPFDILKLIENDETLSTCQMFNAEVCFGSGLRYDFYAGTRNIKLLTSGQIRKIRDCCIFGVNDCEVFL